MLQDFVHVLLILPAGGYGLVVIYDAYISWQEGELRSWEVFTLILAGALMILAGYLLWLGADSGFQLLLLALLSLHSVTLNSQHAQGEVDWRGQLGRLLVSLAVIALAYFAII
jgi:hypothetical protein